MRLLLAIPRVVIGIILGAVILPAAMFGLFHVFASLGGDIPQLLRRFESPRGTPELWARFFYGLLGGVLGGLTGYLLFCLQTQKLQDWVRLCLAVFALSSVSIVSSWFRLTTDGYNTVIEAVVLLWLPTIWSILLLAWGFIAAKRLINQTQK